VSNSTVITSGIGNAGAMPFGGSWWEQTGAGYALVGGDIGAPSGSAGSLTNNTINGQIIQGIAASAGGPQFSTPVTAPCFIVCFPAGLAQGFFTSVTVTKNGGSPVTFTAASATFNPDPANLSAATTWAWNTPSVAALFANGVTTSVVFNIPATPIAGQGDITNPGAWEDASGNIPPKAFQNVPQNTNYPLNGDGRYWFTPDAYSPTPDAITFIGDPTFMVAGSMSLQASIVQAANDGSEVFIAYSLDGVNFTQQQLGPSLQSAPNVPTGVNGQSQLSNQLIATLAPATTIVVKVFASGGTASSSAQPWQVAVAITRNKNERIPWDYPNPFDPISYNCECMDDVTPTETLATLRTDILVELGFATQSANPPPGMANLINSWLIRGQKYLYRRYNQLHTRRMFRWKVNPGQRFYSLKDNDEDVLCNYQMDPNKAIEWAGIQDSRNVWYPLIEGIPPQLYTMIDKPWRPARYEIRQCIEVYPAPDQTYWMWMKAHFGLMSFAADGDSTTIDATLLFLHVLSIAKAHYGKPDANNVQAMANAYRKELIAGTHGTKRYVPGTIAVPPAVRPTLIQYQSNQGG
jgi:hypothetical protein